MSDLEYLLECAKQCHEAKDVADILDIAQDIGQLDNFYQQGNPNTIIQFIQKVVAKHQTEADEHDKAVHQRRTFINCTIPAVIF